MAVHTGDVSLPLIYLNNAATSWPKPPGVEEEVVRCLRAPCAEHGRSTAGGAVDYPSEARKALAGLFCVEKPDHIVFTQSATDSLNLLIHGFAKKNPAPFHVVTTELDHNSVLRPLHTLAGEGRISLTIVPFHEGYVAPSEVKRAIRPETRLIVMSHGSNVLGTLQNIQPIAEYCAANDIFFIADGAQTAGQVPFSLSKIPAGAFVFTGHKALFGMPGTGGFFISDPGAVLPVRQGGTGTNSRLLTQPEDMPHRFEAGTPNYPGIAALLAGVRYIDRMGPDRVARKGRDLASLFVREICANPDIVLYTPAPDLPVVSFNIRNLDNDEAGYILAKAYNIITRTGLHCAPFVHDRIDSGKGCIRVSFSCLTTPDEVMQAAAAVREVAEGANR